MSTKKQIPLSTRIWLRLRRLILPILKQFSSPHHPAECGSALLFLPEIQLPGQFKELRVFFHFLPGFGVKGLSEVYEKVVAPRIVGRDRPEELPRPRIRVLREQDQVVEEQLVVHPRRRLPVVIKEVSYDGK
jgi:hypothetical protein